MIVPPIISGRTPKRSIIHPVSGPITPFSARASEKGSAVIAWLRFRLAATGRKKTWNPCQWTLPPVPFIAEDAPTIHQP